jgi:enolase-phosphatase E1
VSAVLLDIEGTIGDLAFVRDVLFPYARARLLGVLTTRWDDPQIAACVNDARATTQRRLTDANAAAELFLAWMDEDRKTTPLKQLQGIIWHDGYTSGELHGHLYPDAVEAIQAWSARGVPVYIYSSGSVQAQQLYLQHSTSGDLTPFIRGYFDTTTGPKAEPSSYSKITDETRVAAADLTFFSDATAEVAAARAAGCRAYLVARSSSATRIDLQGAAGAITTFAPALVASVV